MREGALACGMLNVSLNLLSGIDRKQQLSISLALHVLIFISISLQPFANMVGYSALSIKYDNIKC